MNLLKTNNALKFFLAIIFATFFYLVIPPQALHEDVFQYYTNFKLDYVDLNIYRFFNSYNLGDYISLAKLNILPIFIYSITSQLPFYYFIFLNQLFLVIIYIKLISSYFPNVNSVKFFLILSPAFYLMTSYIWRSAASLLIALLIFKKWRGIKFFIYTLLTIIFIHPVAIILLFMRLAEGSVKKFNMLFRNMIIFGYALVASLGLNYVAQFSSNSYKFNFIDNLITAPINSLGWMLYVVIIYLVGLLKKKTMDLNNIATLNFLFYFIILFFSLNAHPVAISRMAAYIALISSFLIFEFNRKYLGFYILYNILSLAIFLRLTNFIYD
jgi:hypothetical protein